MKRTGVIVASGLLASLLLGASACSGALGQDAGEASAATRPSLPLRTGFYVRNGATCQTASNATLILLRRSGVGGARDFCAFDRIEQESPSLYRVTLRCTGDQAFAPPGVTAAPHLDHHLYEVLNDRAYRVTSADWTYEARFCPQQTLPEPWRSNPIAQE